MAPKGDGVMEPKERFDQINDYNRRAYDRVNIMAPKGKREIWKAAAAKLGLSMNSLVNLAVDEKIESENLTP